MSFHGSCLCGKITFAVTEFEPLVGHCHCTMCRKFHGAAFSTFADVKLANFKWLSGAALLKSYQASNNTIRQFCQHCGSSLTFCSSYNSQDNTIEIALAAFDDDINISPDAHIYTDTKVNWLKLNDGLPQYLQYRDSTQENK
ncbi:GFA family protein [Thalassotalea sp. ND16A]|uniref:GFA family protein n=1 Tax=Thalassotalea sp. ND16A TaxID=1535422 RepID=UPI00051A02BC|nr:GFA family protein [Thalassotalea sp. ND16A]KGJ88700.1 hypothetical protein ND16A_2402 [Thalassotalea sp. ND16A]